MQLQASISLAIATHEKLVPGSMTPESKLPSDLTRLMLSGGTCSTVPEVTEWVDRRPITQMTVSQTSTTTLPLDVMAPLSFQLMTWVLHASAGAAGVAVGVTSVGMAQVGAATGARVGLTVGLVVGFAVGLTVGVAVGLGVVGVAVGAAVGDGLGDTVGEFVGAGDPHTRSLVADAATSSTSPLAPHGAVRFAHGPKAVVVALPVRNSYR